MDTTTIDVSARDLCVKRLTPGDALPLMHEVWGSERDFAGEYPLVFGEGPGFRGAFGRVLGITARERVAASLGYLERDLITPFGELRVALLGSVTTAPSWRGRGLASALLREAEDWARRSGCVATFLWPTDGRVYENAGYRPAGCEWNVVLPVDLDLGEHLPSRRASATDTRSLLALYEQHPVRVRRSPEEFARLLDCPDMRALVATRGDTIVAYACIGRGADLSNCVHEWAGETNAVLGLVSAIAGEDPDAPRYLLAPDWSNPVAEALLDAGCPALTRAMGMAKLVDAPAAARFLTARTGRDVVVSAGSVFADAAGGPVALAEGDLLSALLPEENQGPELDAVAARLGLEPADLPAYAFAWGLDSI